MKVIVAISTEFRYPRMPIKKGKSTVIEIEVPRAQVAEILAARASLPDYVGMEHLVTEVSLVDDNRCRIVADERVKSHP